MKKIKIAQIGTSRNSHGSLIFESLKKNSDIFEIVGYHLPENEREKFPEKISCFEGFTELTLDEILNNPEIEAVTVETEEIYLTKYAQMVADSKKHMHMEKPGGVNLADFEKLIETVKKNNTVFHTGYMYRYNPFIMELKEQIKNGELGDIISVEAQMNCIHSLETRQWLENFPGGMMFFLGCHLVDIIYSIKGMPKKIIPLNKCSGVEGVTAKDFGMVVFEYENGIGWYDIDGNPTGHDGIANCNYKIGFLDPEGKLVESYDTGYGIRSDPFGINNVEMRYSEDKLTIFAIGGKGGVSFEGTFDMKTKKFTSENIEPEIKVPDIFGFRTMVISEGEEISEEDYVEFSEEEFHEFMALLQIGAWTEVPEDWKGKGSVLEPANILISSEKGKNATMYISPEEGKTLIMIKWGHGQEFKKYYFADKSIAFEAEEFRKELAAKNAG